MSSRDSVDWYERHAQEQAERYEQLSFADVHGSLICRLPAPGKSVVLDVGAGPGRDAAGFARRGDEVVAVEPAASLQEEGRRRHPEIRCWLDDRLPGLDRVSRSGMSFNAILLSAVWMHVAPNDRARAFRKLINLLKPGGLLAFSLRHGPADSERGMHDVNPEEIERLARAHGAFVESAEQTGDLHGRADVSWTYMIIRLPDDGTGALPLLRHIILNDDKSSTYKLALLRTLCRIAGGADGMARDAGEDFVALPLGLVALYWIRLFHPLIAEDLPQAPRYQDGRGLGFVGEPFRFVLRSIAARDLRVGMRFSGDNAAALHRAISDARRTIVRQPANYMTYPGGGPVVQPRARRLGRPPESIVLDELYLLKFGELTVPRNIWHALQRFAVWIEPAIMGEWRTLMQAYAERHGKRLGEDTLVRAMMWPELKRDVGEVRRRFGQLLEAGTGLYCVWSGHRLNERNVEIDHCFPWAAWPCGDLWNLLPAHRRVNGNKGNRLPSAEQFQLAQDRILTWWESAYVTPADSLLPERFRTEARASLPTLQQEDGLSLTDVFEAVEFKRLRLKQDQQIPEWKSTGYE